MKLIITTLAIAVNNISFAQTHTIPAEYRAIKEIYGDLDRDGKNEKVIVYNVKAEEKEDEDMDGVQRELIIFKKAKAGWIIWHRSLGAVGKSKDGGMMGDPFEDITIKNGILLVHQSGGSSWKWFKTDKYRYQQGRFELIGYTSTFGKFCEYWTSFDYNLSTGKVVYTADPDPCANDERGPEEEVHKKEKETFFYKLPQPVTLEQRNATEIKIVTPKYKEELYL